MLKAIPKSVNKRISDISSSAVEFDAAKDDYQTALNNSGHTHELVFQELKQFFPDLLHARHWDVRLMVS